MGYGNSYDDMGRDLAGTARGTWGSWLFVVLLVAGLALSAAGFSPLDGKPEEAGPLVYVSLGVSILIAIALAWRVRQGKGWLAGSILLVWWAGELLFKLASGQLGMIWIALHLAGIANLALGVKACWRLRGQEEEQPDLVATFE